MGTIEYNPEILTSLNCGILDGVLEVDFLFHPTRHSLRHLDHKKLFYVCSTMSVECTNPISILVLAVLTGLNGLI